MRHLNKNKSSWRHSAVAIFCFACGYSLPMNSALAQSHDLNEKPNNRSGWKDTRPLREGPSDIRNGRHGSHPMRRGQRNKNGRPPRDGFDGPAGRRGKEGKRWQDLTQAQRKQIMQFLDTHFPRMSVELRNLKQNKPEVFKRRIRRVIPEVRRVMEMMKVNPQRATLHIQQRRLDMQMRQKARMYRKHVDQQQQAQLRKELHNLATQAFDIQLQLHQMEITDLQVRLGELVTRVEETRELRPQLIRQRVEMLLSSNQNHPLDGPLTQPKVPR